MKLLTLTLIALSAFGQTKAPEKTPEIPAADALKVYKAYANLLKAQQALVAAQKAAEDAQAAFHAEQSRVEALCGKDYAMGEKPDGLACVAKPKEAAK